MNECENNVCPDHSSCQNIEGSYTCDCQQGFVSSGGVCVGKKKSLSQIKVGAITIYCWFYFKSHILPWRLKKTSAKLFFKNSIFCYFSFVVYILISESFKMIQKEIDKIYNQLHVIFLIFESLTASYKTTVCAIILTCGENKLSFIWNKFIEIHIWGNVLKNNHRFNKKCI